MELTRIVERMRGIPEKQEKCASRRRDVNRMKMLVERQYRQRQRIATTGRLKCSHIVIDLERLVETPKRILGLDIWGFGSRSAPFAPRPFDDITRSIDRLGNLSPWHAPECSNK